MASTEITLQVRIERHGRQFDFYINEKFMGTRDITDFAEGPEELLERFIAYLDERKKSDQAEENAWRDY